MMAACSHIQAAWRAPGKAAARRRIMISAQSALSEASHRCCFFTRSNSTSSGSSSNNSHSNIDDRQSWERIEQQAILEQAATLTKSLYRRCLRSARLAGTANAQDEVEFTRRERKEQMEMDGKGEKTKNNNDDVRLGMLSMLPRVDREKELRWRSSYYAQYARENFVAESKNLPPPTAADNTLEAHHVHRCTQALRRGEAHRRWLVGDMGFPNDPWADQPTASGETVEEAVQKFERRAAEFLRALGTATAPIDGQADGSLKGSVGYSSDDDEEDSDFYGSDFSDSDSDDE